MEKDHFKDRSPQCTERKYIKQTSIMYICTKENQRKINSDDMSKLTKIIVCTHLSKRQYHPRGLKVHGYIIKDNENPTPEQAQKVVDFYHKYRARICSGEDKALSSRFAVGRGVYLLDEKGNKL